MTAAHAKPGFDEPVTPRTLQAAIERGARRDDPELHAQTLQYLPSLQSLLIRLADGSAVALPVRNYPELAQLTPAELERMEIGLGGSALCLDERDLHVSIAGLLSASQPLMELAATLVAARNGRRRSAAKAQASRVNGKKGGRPQKPAPIP